MSSFLCLFLFAIVSLASTPAFPADLTEKNLRQDMAYYNKTSKTKNLNANDRLFILNRLRKKYSGTELDLSDLYAEIDHWSGANQAEKKGTNPATALPPAEGGNQLSKNEPSTVSNASSGATLNKILVTETRDFTRIHLELSGNCDYKDEMIEGNRDGEPPVIVVYLYNTREKLKKISRNFSLKRGLIRQVQAKTVSSNPPAVKVSAALRKASVYEIKKRDGKLILSFSKKPEVDRQAGDQQEEGLSAFPSAAPTFISLKSTSSFEAPPEGLLGPATGIAVLETQIHESSATVPANISVPAEPITQTSSPTLSGIHSQEIHAKYARIKRKSQVKSALPWAAFFASLGLVLGLLH